MINNKYIVYIAFLWLLSFTSCFDSSNMTVKPNALGKINEIVVLTEDELWDSPVQDTFDYYFGSAYPIMPRPEPLFDMRHFNLNELDMEPLRRELRTYVLLADLSQEDARTTKMIKSDIGNERFQKALSGEITTTVGRDKWAKGQLIIYLMGENREALFDVIRENYPAVARRINEHDKLSLNQKVYAAKTNIGLSNTIEQDFDIHIEVPNKYQKAIYNPEDNIAWLRKDDKDYIMNIVVRKFPYTSENQLSTQNIKKLRNDYGRDYMSTSEAGSYMIINDKDLPVFDYTYDIDGRYTREIRGIWEMVNDYLGGPFATYVVLNEEKNEIIFVDTFIYAPGKDKRDMMQQLDHIVKTATIP